MKSKQSKTAIAHKRHLNRVVRKIADELLTVNYGYPRAETGDRLAIKKEEGNTERDLGGRSRQSIETVLRRHLSFML